MNYQGWFDGSAKPNPGAMKIGGYLKDEKGVIVHQFSTQLVNGTNNRAEFLALYSLCTILYRYKIDSIHIRGDSQLVVRQINGESKCKEPHLKAIKAGVLYLLKDIKWKISHVSRTRNKKADSLTR